MKRKRSDPRCGHTNLKKDCERCARVYEKWNGLLEAGGLPEDLRRCGASIWEKDKVSYTQMIAADYYRQIQQAAELEAFESQVHELIMKMRGEGKKICEIIVGLRKKRKRIHRETVRHVIRRYEHKWKVREWTLKEMNLKTPTESSNIPQFLYRPNTKT